MSDTPRLATDPTSVALYLGFLEAAAQPTTTPEARAQWFDLVDVALSGGFADLLDGDA